MAPRDPEKTKRNKEIAKLTIKLESMLPEVCRITGYEQLSLNAKIGGKHQEFFNVTDAVVYSPDQFIAMWIEGMINYLDSRGENKEQSNVYELFNFIQKYKLVREYTLTFLERTYLRNYDALSRKRPKSEDAFIWIGQERASYGIFITPRFKNGNWENDRSEIRHFLKEYWTIGHIMKTGLVIPFENEKIEFTNINQYLSFLKNTIVRASGSVHEKEIAQRYCEYVRSAENPEKVPLLIPEFRYNGIESLHKYRLDFTIIDPYTLAKFGFEISPWSSHGKITGTKSKKQKQINDEARTNFEKEMKKHKDYYRKHNVFILIYTDSDLENYDLIFEDMRKYLNPAKSVIQLKLHAINDLIEYK